MTDQEGLQEPAHSEPAPKSGVSTKMVILLAVIAMFAGVIAAKYLTPSQTVGGGGQASKSLTSVRNDAAADYEAAVKTGKPIYVLFHSLS